MTAIQYTLSDAFRINCRRVGRNEEKTDEESGFLRFENVIDFIGSRHHSLKDMTLTFGKTSFPPFIAIVGSFQNGLLIVPISEYITGYIVGIDVL